MNTKDLILKELSIIEAQRDAMLAEIKLYPPGELQSYTSHGRTQYVQSTHHNGKRFRHGINRDTQLIRELARKRYLKEGIQILEHNILTLQNAANSTVLFSPDSILQNIRSSLPELPDEYCLYSSDSPTMNTGSNALDNHLKSCRKWADGSYEQSRYNLHKLKITTTQGLKVRSKSEAIIANLLHEYGIPFRYEPVVYLEGAVAVPDFSFLTMKKNEIYWEHAGMLNDARYSFRHHTKMLLYESAGYFPWKNLIVTYDTDNEINTKMIESIINNMLLPMLCH